MEAALESRYRCCCANKREKPADVRFAFLFFFVVPEKQNYLKNSLQTRLLFFICKFAFMGGEIKTRKKVVFTRPCYGFDSVCATPFFV
jgi:hypothetical protein